jgi:hypothetical protein
MKKLIFMLAMLLYSIASYSQMTPAIIAKIKRDYQQNQSWRSGSYYAFEKLTVGEGFSRTFLYNKALKELLAERNQLVLENNSIVEQIDRINALKQEQAEDAMVQAPQPKLVTPYDELKGVKYALQLKDQEIANLKAKYNKLSPAKKKGAGAWTIAIQFLHRGQFGGLHRGVVAFAYFEETGIFENSIQFF